MSNPHQPIMQTGWVDNPAEAVTHIYRMQDKRDPFRYMDFDPRAWNFIVVPILPDDAVVGCTNADQPDAVLPCADCGEPTDVWHDGTHLCWKCRA